MSRNFQKQRMQNLFFTTVVLISHHRWYTIYCLEIHRKGLLWTENLRICMVTYNTSFSIQNTKWATMCCFLHWSRFHVAHIVFICNVLLMWAVILNALFAINIYAKDSVCVRFAIHIQFNDSTGHAYVFTTELFVSSFARCENKTYLYVKYVCQFNCSWCKSSSFVRELDANFVYTYARTPGAPLKYNTLHLNISPSCCCCCCCSVLRSVWRAIANNVHSVCA